MLHWVLGVISWKTNENQLHQQCSPESMSPSQKTNDFVSNQLCQNAFVLIIQKLLLNFLMILLSCDQVTFITDSKSQTPVQKHPAYTGQVLN